MPKKGSLRKYCGACCIATISAALIPAFAHAQILISEAMYDPPGSDDNQEWIELYNAGSDAVDITKYTFSDGSSATKHGLNVPPKNGGIGSLAMQPGAYLVIADDAATFEAAYASVANVIDSTMSLPDPNAGVSNSITLYDDQKNLADTFSYTAGTNADNKGDSAQRAGSGIIPAAPTPGSANAQTADLTQDAADDTGESASTTQQSATQSQPQAPVSSYVPPPLPMLFADAGADSIETVAADAEFSGRAYDRAQEEVTSLVRYVWNFGDGATAEGKTAVHHWDYPGRYAVTLTVANGDDTAIDRIIVTADPAELAFIVYDDGSAEIRNLAGRDLDLSRWIVRSGGRSFALPEHTLILAGSPLRIGEKTLGFWSGPQTELDYPNGVRVLGAGQSTQPVPAPVSAPAPVPPPVSYPAAKPAAAPHEAAEAADPPEEPAAPAGSTSTATSSQAAAAASAARGMPWLWGAVGVAGFGAGAGFLARTRRKTEWEIEEEDATV